MAGWRGAHGGARMHAARQGARNLAQRDRPRPLHAPTIRWACGSHIAAYAMIGMTLGKADEVLHGEIPLQFEGLLRREDLDGWWTISASGNELFDQFLSGVTVTAFLEGELAL